MFTSDQLFIDIHKKLEQLNRDLLATFLKEINAHKNSTDKRFMLLEQEMRRRIKTEIDIRFNIVLERVSEMTKKIDHFVDVFRGDREKMEREFRDKAGQLNAMLEDMKKKLHKSMSAS